NLQYTHDEKYCARVVTNEVHFYESDDLGTVWNKLRVEGVADFAISPGKTNSVAVFVPERKVLHSILDSNFLAIWLTITIGSTCCSKGFQRPSLCFGHFTEDIL